MHALERATERFFSAFLGGLKNHIYLPSCSPLVHQRTWRISLLKHQHSLHKASNPQNFCSTLAVKIDFNFLFENPCPVSMKLNTYLTCLPGSNRLFRPIDSRTAALGTHCFKDDRKVCDILKNKVMFNSMIQGYSTKIVLCTRRSSNDSLVGGAN